MLLLFNLSFAFQCFVLALLTLGLFNLSTVLQHFLKVFSLCFAYVAYLSKCHVLFRKIELRIKKLFW